MVQIMEFNDSKLIVMLVSVVWGRIQERTRNFGHLIHETCPRNCVWSVFKFYKKQTKSENHETCWDIVILYMETMINISEDFVHVIMYDAYHLVGLFTKSWNFFGDSSVCKHRTWQLSRNILKFLSQPPHYIMTSGQVSWFSDFVCFL